MTLHVVLRYRDPRWMDAGLYWTSPMESAYRWLCQYCHRQNSTHQLPIRIHPLLPWQAAALTAAGRPVLSPHLMGGYWLATKLPPASYFGARP